MLRARPIAGSEPGVPGEPSSPARLNDEDLLLGFFTTMIRIRRFDERARELFLEGHVKGTAHSYVGQEAVAAGACAALDEGDFVVSHHRGHGHCIAKGARLDRMMAELFGRSTGYCGGLGGSMHIAALDLNILGANGIVGAGVGIATGAGLSAKLRNDGTVGIAFFGDGSVNEGSFHEALNMAGLWRLPIVYVCENNQYGLSASVSESSAVPQLSRRAASYGIPGVTIDGNDVEAVYTAVLEAVGRARRGEGPTFIEALTYRWGDHSMRGNLPRYRTHDEEHAWITRDPIPHLERVLTGRGVPLEALRSIREAAEQELSEAEAFAKSSPEPDASVLESSVYAPHVAAREPDTPGEREIGFVQALNEALHQEMESDERVVLLGEDVGKIGGIFGVSTGLLDRFGPDRVRDTPISEAGIAGLGVGAALTGMRPVIEVQFFDFVTLMMDMIVNQAAKLRFMLGGSATVPLVVRGPQGAGIRMAAQHSQCLETWFTHVPGLIVAAPSTPYDAKGLLATAIRDDNPVVFLEHKLLYLTGKGPVPEGSYAIPFGKAAVRRRGKDITIVATQAMVPRAITAANDLARDGIDAEVLDPRTLWPLDEDAILTSVRKTHRLVIAHEAPVQHGFGAELAAVVQEQAFDWLDAPIARVGAPRVPMPYNDALERHVIPSAQRIAEAARRSCEGMGA